MSKNRLANETSPYLLQHADNPVDWWPWGPEALDEAKKQDRPILLSIGYAACHWCHVMAHESFENPEIAALMNELFVNIKVDREERPDIDTVYQSALALLGEHGGWPLTMFLTPDGHPFWGGTYFPPSARYGRPGLPDVLAAVAQTYRAEPAKISNNVDALRDALSRLDRAATDGQLPADALERAAASLLPMVDMVHGGIGPAPKFPHSSVLLLLWRAWQETGQKSYFDAVTISLERMCQGGIYDHLGGGFARYSTDSRWLVPHFEKMLYDNAQLVDVLTIVWRTTRSPLFERRIRETVDWMLREMRLPEGAFAGTLDADSEGEEGRFYVWTAAEIDCVLDDRAAEFKRIYDVSPAGNWEGKSILNLSQAPAPLSATVADQLAQDRAKLLAHRDNRVRPGLDDKVLADWNGLAIAALTRAADTFAEPAWRQAAIAAYRFIVDTMVADGRLRHSWRAGRAAHPAILDDYANMSAAAIALYESTGDHKYIDDCERWFEIVCVHYDSETKNGYYFSADDVSDVIVRSRTVYDNATPAGNAVYANVLTRLFFLTGDARYRGAAEGLFSGFAAEAERNPFGVPTFLLAHDLFHNAIHAVLVGDSGDASYDPLLDCLQSSPATTLIVQRIAPESALPEQHPAAAKVSAAAGPAVFLCRDLRCSLPVGDPAELDAALKGHARDAA